MRTRSAGTFLERVIQNLDVPRRETLEFLERAVAVHGVAAHRQIRRIDLQMIPACTIASYSTRSASASAVR